MRNLCLCEQFDKDPFTFFYDCNQAFDSNTFKFRKGSILLKSDYLE